MSKIVNAKRLRKCGEGVWSRIGEREIFLAIFFPTFKIFLSLETRRDEKEGSHGRALPTLPLRE